MSATHHSTPKLDISQAGNETLGIKSQLNLILTIFLQQNWKVSLEQIQSYSKSSSSSIPFLQSPSKSAKVKVKDSKAKKINDKEIGILMEMGFSYDMSVNALKISKNLEEATH